MDLQAIFAAVQLMSKEASSAAAEVSTGFQFEPAAFVSSLKYMGLGMLGIFIVIGVIIGCTYLLNAVFSRKEKKDHPDDRQ